MRSNATQHQASEEEYPGLETNGKMAKGTTEEEGPALVESSLKGTTGANCPPDVSLAGRRRPNARGSSRARIV
jgi:hypothetical protein